jgi:hypothetical protein
VGEGLDALEVGREAAHHAHELATAETGPCRALSIVEASLLAVVAILAAWSGYGAAKWGTESSLALAQAATMRTEASRANLSAQEDRNFDSLTFNAWITAYVSGDQVVRELTERRFRPEFKVAFDAWMGTGPFAGGTSPGPTYMPEYVLPEAARADELDHAADERYAAGAEAADHADGYVRTTVFLATVLFLAGISGHFRLAPARVGLVAVAAAILVFTIFLMVTSPAPPA